MLESNKYQMPPKQLFKALSRKRGNTESVKSEILEKDYIMNLILDAIANCPSTQGKMFIKGAAAIYKCYNYQDETRIKKSKLSPMLLKMRFTEDLDMTVTPDMMDVEKLHTVFKEIAVYLKEKYGLTIDQFSFGMHLNKKQRINGHFKRNCRGVIHFAGPMYEPDAKSHANTPSLALDFTADEKIVFGTRRRVIRHPYDALNENNTEYIQKCKSQGIDTHLYAQTYSMRDIFAEKIRSLFDRISVRDLYDCIYLMNHPEMDNLRRAGIGVAMIEKFRIKGIPLKVTWENFMDRKDGDGEPIDVKEAFRKRWKDSMDRLMIEKIPFDEIWQKTEEVIQFAASCLQEGKAKIIQYKCENPKGTMREYIDTELQGCSGHEVIVSSSRPHLNGRHNNPKQYDH